MKIFRLNRFRRIGLFLAILAAFLIMSGTVGYAEEGADPKTPSRNSKYDDRDFVIDAYDIHVKVNENNTLDITENLTVWFHEARHGIYRDIPLSNTVVRQDGTVTKNHTRVTDVNVSDTFEAETQDGKYHIRIGDANETVTGEKKYTIRYNYNLGRDPLKDKDEFYFNLVGSEWTSAIGNITFSIEMPKDFDKEKLGFSAGWERTADSTGVVWSVSGREITGSYEGILESGQALTVRLELPEGYFVDAGLENSLRDIICYSLPILFLIISFFLWFKFGKDDLVVDTVEFYPPDGVSSLDAGFLYRGRAVASDVTSLLIYLANRGFIRIEETEERGVFRKKQTFRFVKLKDYDGDNQNERTFMDGLFHSDTSLARQSVTAGQLYDSFYRTTNKILTNVNSKKNMDKLFEKNTGFKSFLVMVMILASAFLIAFPPVVSYDSIDTLLFLLFPIIAFSLFFGMILGGKGKGRQKGKMKSGGCLSFILGLIFAVALGLVPTVVLLFPLLEENTFYMIMFFVGLACIGGMIIFFIYMPKRTPYGIQMLGRLEGFRNFLEVAEKQQLEMLVQENPQYFYHILPYTYVLGVSDTWMKKFETIQLQAPDWYGGGYYDMYTFHDCMDRTMETATRAMTSSPSESSGGGGGSSGGGFSGGGSGGGGGGSW